MLLAKNILKTHKFAMQQATWVYSTQSTHALIFYWSELSLLPKVAIKIQLNWLKASY